MTSARTDWNERVREIVAGTWHDSGTDRGFAVAYEAIVIEDDSSGREAEQIAPLQPAKRLAIVSGRATHAVLGKRAEAPAQFADVRPVVLERAKADRGTSADVAGRTSDADGVVAVGSGSSNDVREYVTYSDGRPYAVFASVRYSALDLLGDAGMLEAAVANER